MDTEEPYKVIYIDQHKLFTKSFETEQKAIKHMLNRFGKKNMHEDLSQKELEDKAKEYVYKNNISIAIINGNEINKG